ncbi:hypothetical protein [Rhizorhapis suberifaciens]|uniref:Uncharacterized protein n=1 Tax=Rhizorhapis suberifaciens TaxID=13656 RepID=A0A840HTR5_9SPHN|nr:hypothetical protein [Rhizorhapis suberifaciens]MBB4640990.1 hypothetical protein [Rhizorhapis suberifaciens]
MIQKTFIALAFFGLIVATIPANARDSAPSAQLSYADVADLAADTPLAIEAQVRKAIKVKPERAPGLAQGHQRFFVEARVIKLIRGRDGIGRDINYVVDLPLDFRGRTAKLKKRHVLLFARPVSGGSGSIQLVAPDAQIDWSPESETMLRAILAQAVRPDAPPRITGVGSAFYSAGSIPGEGETQIFLKTATGDPVSLSILRRPGQDPRWAVALGEIVDESASIPAPQSLLWYRLACSLPRELPEPALSNLSSSDAEMARADYKVVIAGLGPCGRTRKASSPSSASTQS